MDTYFRIAAATFGAAIMRELFSRYRRMKARRRALPPEVRNAGFWTDVRIFTAEVVVTSAVLAVPFAGIVIAAAIFRPIEDMASTYMIIYSAILIYVLAIYLFLWDMNRRDV